MNTIKLVARIAYKVLLFSIMMVSFWLVMGFVYKLVLVAIDLTIMLVREYWITIITLIIAGSIVRSIIKNWN